jgi:peptidyl-prolyl cis-trans isomerase C
VTVTVNGIAVEVARWPSPTVAAVRELLRQRAVALGFLAPDITDDDEIGAAIERLLSEEVVVPSPTEAECQRYYDTHLKEFWSGDLVHARHILFQVTPSTSLNLLVELHYLAASSAATSERGGRPTTTYTVNPRGWHNGYRVT